MTNKIKAFGYLNHLAHNYELLHLAKKYPIQFFYLENNVRKWSKYSGRPEPTTWLSPDEFQWVQSYSPGQYDIAITHLDQQATDPNIGKGQLYRQLNEIIQDIPKVVINHGCTTWDSERTEEIIINGGDVFTPRGKIHLDGMKDLIGDNFMVVNSYTAAEHWGWGYPIIHGIKASDWAPFDNPKEPRVILPVSPGGLDKYYNRSLITAIKGAVKERTGLDVIHFNVNLNFDNGDHFEQYRDFVGRSLIAIFPFLDSPMPRSRSESMMTGACVLSSRHHNADEFIENGKNGFILPDNPLSYAEVIDILINEGYKEATDIGQRGKQTALNLFNHDRWLDDWWWLINEVIAGRRPEWDGKTKIWDKK